MQTSEAKAAYFRRRAEAATAAAEAASLDRIRAIHRELAGLYRARAQTLAGGSPEA